ncbi:hypothetical protein [Bradyrhizobium cenepequi]|uniref:hypothetical protein n=1 Tax=Bradyrhizobium cenepequi TaxID=2821403 RepID=UPI001CE2A2E7
MIIKVKEPQIAEWTQLRNSQILLTCLHPASDPEQAIVLLKPGCTAICLGSRDLMRRAGLPLLSPMSEVVGRLAIEAAGNGRALGRLQMTSGTTLTPCLRDPRRQLDRRKFRARAGKRYQAAPFARNWKQRARCQHTAGGVLFLTGPSWPLRTSPQTCGTFGLRNYGAAQQG